MRGAIDSVANACPAARSPWKTTQSVALLRHNRARTEGHGLEAIVPFVETCDRIPERRSSYNHAAHVHGRRIAAGCIEVETSKQVSRPGKPTTARVSRRYKTPRRFAGVRGRMTEGRERDYNLMLRLYNFDGVPFGMIISGGKFRDTKAAFKSTHGTIDGRAAV